MLLPAVTLENSFNEDLIGLVSQVSVCGHIIVDIVDDDYDVPSLKNLIMNVPCAVYARGDFKDASQIVKLFDAGVSEVITKNHDWLSELPQDRLILEGTLEELHQVGKNEHFGYYVNGDQQTSITISEVSDRFWSEAQRLIIADENVQLQAISSLDKIYVDVVVKKNIGQIDLGLAIAASLVSDRKDGLYTTLVIDESGAALGLVYSNEESICEAVKLKRGVYHSRKRGLWFKGDSSGAIQDLLYMTYDCDRDCLVFVVHQRGVGFCHLNNRTCFGNNFGFNLSTVMRTIEHRMKNPVEKSYTNRLFNDPALLHSKIKEEAAELCDSKNKEEVSWEAADVLYFTLVKCAREGVSLKQVEKNLEAKSKKVTRRPGNAKEPLPNVTADKVVEPLEDKPVENKEESKEILVRYENLNEEKMNKLCQRPAILNSDVLEKRCADILAGVRKNGDKAILEYTSKFDKVELDTPVLKLPLKNPPALDPEIKAAIDLAFDNIYKFHDAQLPRTTMEVETMKGVNCSRFVRPIERVGLYVPGGTAVLPSTTLMLGIPALVAGCEEIVIATPPKKDGSIAPEILYIAQKVGASCILRAGGAQAIGALAYGTQTVPKVDKICGPGNAYVTAAKMIVQNDTTAPVSIDMPAGPSEVLVICDSTCDPEFVAIDLLSQAEHGVDSQVVLIAVDMKDQEIDEISNEIERLVSQLPREKIAREALTKSYCIKTNSLEEAMKFSNLYGPEHLIIQTQDPRACIPLVKNAGSLFLGPYSPESCGDYASGTNHTLPTYGYARMYSGVNTATFLKFITAQELTEEGLENIGDAVATLAKVEELDAHRNAVLLRLNKIRNKK